MPPRNHWAARLRRHAMLGAAVVAALTGTPVHAADWDTLPNNGSIDGGTGLWSTGISNWTSNGGLSNGGWINGDAAVFGGASGGTVTILGGGVAASTIIFNLTGNSSLYTIQSQTASDVLLMNGGGIETNVDARINAVISGVSGFSKLGSATLTLGGTNTISGNLTLVGGTLELASAGGAGTTSIIVNAGTTLRNNSVTAANAINLAGGTLSFASNDSTLSGAINLSAASSVNAAVAGKTLTLSGVLSGTNPLAVSGPGNLLVNNAGNFSGAANTFTGNLTQGGGGVVALAYQIAAPSGQTFTANSGTLTLGNSVAGAMVMIANGASVTASGGVINLYGRAAAPGIGVSIGGTLTANSGGRINVGDGLDDAAQVQLLGTSQLVADGGTISLRPRSIAMALDGTNGAITVANGGVLALGAGNADLLLNTNVIKNGAWVLANEGSNTFTVAGGVQDTTAGLTLRASSGVLRYDVSSTGVDSSWVNGSVNLEARGGTIDINNAGTGRTLNYADNYTLTGWGQIGTSASNLTHVIPAAGATFYAGGSTSVTLNLMGGFDETSGGKARFQIGDGDSLGLSVPNSSPATAYQITSLTIDPQTGSNTARLIVAGGHVQANLSAFINPANRVRFDIQNGTLISDVNGASGVLVNTTGTTPINVSNGTFISTAASFTLGNGLTIGGTGTLFATNGGVVTSLVANGTVDLNGTLGAAINASSTGMMRLDAGETLSLISGGDLGAMSLGYAGASGNATLEVNSGTNLVRIGSSTAITNPAGPFTGTAEYKVTTGTLQVDSSNAAAVTITGTNLLTVPRSAGTLNGLLTLNGGTFYVGATNVAATTTVDAAGTFIGKGILGHSGTNDTFINNGTVVASGGNLTINAGTIRATGTFNPNGQTITFGNGVRDVSGTSTLRISGSNGGTVVLGGTTSSYSGGTTIDNTGGTGPTLKVTANAMLGSGSVTLSGGTISMLTDSGLTYTGTPVVVQGSLGSTISFDRLASQSGKSIRFSSLSIGGQSLGLIGANSQKLYFNNGTTIRSGGTSLMTFSGGGGVTMDLGAVNLQGALSLSISSSIVDLGALSGSGSLTRTGSSGTLELMAAASGFTGSFNMNTVGGITNVRADNALAGGTWNAGTLGNASGTFNVTNTLGLNLSSGTVSGGSFNLGTGAILGSMNGAQVNLAGGTVFANVAGALGSGTMTITGGQLKMRGDTATAFGGTVNITGGNSVVVDRFSGTNGVIHSINALGVTSTTMNLSGLNNVGLQVIGDTTISGTAGSTIVNNAASLNLNRVLLNAPLGFNGTGAISITRLGGTSSLVVGIDPAAAMSITSAADAGFTGSMQVAQGTVNLNSAAGSLAGGSVSVTGGTLNLGVTNALQGATISLSSGFINANAANALAGQPVTITNGSLTAATNNALGASAITMTGGNVTALGAGSLGTATISMDRGVLALRSDTSGAFGTAVTITGTNFATISVASINSSLVVPNQLSIGSLALGGQTLNITGDGQDTLIVTGAVALSGTNPTTFNNTAADGLIQGAVTGTGGVIKSGGYKMTFDGGGNFGTARVDAGTLVINNLWTSAGVTVGGSNGAAALELGGSSGVNAPGTITVNAGTLKISKATPANAIPTATALTVGKNGDVLLQYAGLTTGTIANTVNVDASLANRTLTISAGSGSLASQTSALLFNGTINRTGTNALNVTVGADQTLDDGLGNLVRPPSRTVMVASQTFTTPMIHGGGIVIAKGNLNAIASPTPTVFGQSTNALSMTLNDSTIGAMAADGQSGATFGRTVTTTGDWMRLGGFYNPSGAAGTQTVQFVSGASFAWNGTNAISTVISASSPTSGATLSRWNGLFADPQTVLQINSGSILDNVISVSGTNVTSAAPVYVGGGGTVRLNTSFDATLNTSLVRGLSGLVGVLDSTTLQSLTGGKHFDGVQLLGGTFQVSGTNQTLAGGLQALVSPANSAQVTSNLIADSNLTITGTGTAKAFKIGSGATMLRSGTGTINFNGDHNHDPGSTFQANQGTTNFNTDAGSTSKSNYLSVTVSNGASVNFTVTQHLANVAVNSGIASLTSGASNGSKALDVTGVTTTAGKLDITNNRLIVDYAPGNSPFTSIAAQITSGYNAAGTKWTGNGITSSTAASNSSLYAIGFGEASDLIGPSGGTFGSETVDATSIVARLTRMGDANLDGVVDVSDLARMAARYGLSGSWANGDFNYDNVVDVSDLALLAANYGLALGSEPVPSEPINFSADLATAFASVPEPGTLGMLAIAGAALMLRRRRRA